MDSENGSLSIGGFDIPYIIDGDGPLTLVIGSVVYYPRVFASALRRHLRLVFLDHRGFATMPASPDPSSFKLDTILDDIERARRELDLGRIAVMGHSGHGLMALEYAKKYPEHVSHVIMIGIAPTLGAEAAQEAEQYWEDSVDPTRKALMEENLRRVPDEELAQLAFPDRFVRGTIRNGPRVWYDPGFDATHLLQGVLANEISEKIWGEDFATIDVTKGLDEFTKPVFLALGRYDYSIAPPSSWNPIRPKVPNLTLRVFERSGHTPQFEEAELFQAELLSWMNSHP